VAEPLVPQTDAERIAKAVAVIDAALLRLNPGQGFSVARRRSVKAWGAAHLLAVRSFLTDEPYTGPRPWER
jgi:hypothetical protein